MHIKEEDKQSQLSIILDEVESEEESQAEIKAQNNGLQIRVVQMLLDGEKKN